jgi:hypothetical protein
MSGESFEGWVILELMGHRRLGGYLREQQLGGISFLRLDTPEVDGSPPATQLYGAGSVYCITPTTEEVARLCAQVNRPEPVHAWELPKVKALPRPDVEAELDELEEQRQSAELEREHADEPGN